MELKIHHSIFTLKNVWQKMHGDRKNVASVYQSYEVNLIVYLRMLIYVIINGYFPIYCEVLENDRSILIAPICKYLGMKKYCSLGDFNGFQVYDFIYGADVEAKKFSEAVRFLVKELDADRIELKKVVENSLLRNTRRIFAYYEETSTENVKICFEAGAAAWYGGLSKSAKQNLRTAHNRARSNNYEIRVQVIQNAKLSKKELKQIIDIYTKRHERRYGVSTSWIKKVYLKTIDISTCCQQKGKDSFYSMLWFGNNLVAFMSGLIEKNGKSVIVPRLSIDDEFSWYSPGMILISETIKWLDANTDIECLDLSKGAERYKLTAGGQIYPLFDISIHGEDA